MPTPTEFFRWWIVDERTGERRRTTYRMTIRGAIFCLAVCIRGVAYAGGAAALIQASDYVQKAEESKLTVQELKFLATARAQPNVRTVQLVSIHPAALSSTVIAVALPDGTTREFTGTITRSPAPKGFAADGTVEASTTDILQWIGRAKTALQTDERGMLASARFGTHGKSFIGHVEANYRAFTFGGTIGSRVLVTELYPYKPVEPASGPLGEPTRKPPPRPR